MHINQINKIVIVIFGLLISCLTGQSPDDANSDIYPRYFKAIENAVNGYFEEAVLVFYEMYSRIPSNQEAKIFVNICNDAIAGKLTEKSAQNLFEGANIDAAFGKPEDVLKYFDKAIAEEAEYFPYYLIRGTYAAKKKMFERAVADFSRAIQLEPTLYLGYFYRGKTYYEANNLQNALSDFNEAIKLNPNYSPEYVYRARIYAEKTEIDLALNDFKKAYDINPESIKSLENSAVLNTIGTLFINQSDYDNALNAFNEAIAADERWYEPYLNRGVVQRLLGNFEMALNDINKAIELNPQTGKTWFNRGLIYKDQKEFQKAKYDLEKSLKYEDLDQGVYFNLAEMYREQKDYNKATDYYLKAIEVAPENIWIYYQLGILYDQRRGFKLAVKYYEEFLNRASNDYYKHKINIKDRMDRIKEYLKKKK